MNVMVCIPCLLTGGTEIQTLNLVRALVEGGHKVTTVCYFEHSEAMIENYRQAGSEVLCLNPAGKRIGGWRGVLFLYRGLRRAMHLARPDVAHVQYMAPGAIPIVLLRLLGVRQIITTAHTAADIYPTLRVVHFVQRQLVRAFTCITCRAEESFFGSSQLFHSDIKLLKRNHFTIYNALPSYITPIGKGRTFANKKQITIGVVSRLERIKGMDLVVPAFAQLHEKQPNTRLLVVGDGKLRSSMQAEAKTLGDAVQFVGRKPQNELMAFYDNIDILLMPSRSEGFGLTAIEGMSRGCVVVASHVGGLPEVVKDGETGLLHKSEQAGDIVDKCAQLITNQELMAKLSAQALLSVDKFSFERYSESFNALYSKLK